MTKYITKRIQYCVACPFVWGDDSGIYACEHPNNINLDDYDDQKVKPIYDDIPHNCPLKTTNILITV